ncbi:hypothetical protein GCM10010844_42910 [Deinococcus radiotolerans]|uniref:Uncharacterized protein n=1 Tax=Deinococcus radiotolerans TaxID=1309407 RepID=A0ABQ2FRH6_9DEIO|nr:hypothetical protein GCM10010844_42910 [Deinococcus radiotolerans]
MHDEAAHLDQWAADLRRPAKQRRDLLQGQQQRVPTHLRRGAQLYAAAVDRHASAGRGEEVCCQARGGQLTEQEQGAGSPEQRHVAQYGQGFLTPATFPGPALQATLRVEPSPLITLILVLILAPYTNPANAPPV